MDFGEEFLTRPGFFPARLAGEPWGERAVELVLPGGRYRISGLSAAQEAVVRESFRGFFGPAPQPLEGTPTQIRVFRAPPGDFRDFGAPREYRLAVGYLPDAVRVAGIDFMGLLELPGPGEDRGGLWTSREEACLFRGAFENFLRVVVAYQVFREGAALVHSAALHDGEAALLFPGCSGAGKSTLCGLAEAAGWRVLGDELHVLAAPGGSGELWVEGVPFAGDFGPVEGPRAALPLVALVGLRHAAADELRPVSDARALGLLLSTTPYLNRDPFRAGALEELLAEMLARRSAPSGGIGGENTACRELGFTAASRLEVLAELRTGKEAVA